MNPNWTRWIHASLITYVKTEFLKLNVIPYFEPEEKTQVMKLPDYVEFRWNGPIAREYSRGYWCLYVDLNFVINSTTNRADTYNHKKVVGLVQSILKNSINVLRYGDGDLDDESLLGCLQLRVDMKDAIATNYFGQMQDIEVEQSTIEAMYSLTGKLT